MTKKDFIKLADVMRASKPASLFQTGYEYGRQKQWHVDLLKLADACAQSNPRFNREEWLGYVNGECGPNGGKVAAA